MRMIVMSFDEIYVSDVERVDLSYCTVLTQGVDCKHKCSKNVDLVCGTNGKTYLNKCYLQAEFCE